MIEAIPLSIEVRMYFDVDWFHPRHYKDFLHELRCIGGEWAVSDGCRTGKTSYHIVSKTYKCSIPTLRILITTLRRWFDRSVYYDVFYRDYAFFRLPNQSKNHGDVNPMKIVQGELEDFIVTDTTGLISYESMSAAQDTGKRRAMRPEI
jgi:hypothetical protein